MAGLRLLDRPLRLGVLLGVTFGIVDLLFAWLAPLADDSIAALLRFYGPMFLAWAIVAFRAAQRRGRMTSGVTAGLLVAFATFATFYVVNLLRVNLFLEELTARADWQNMIRQFRESGRTSLRGFVNLTYLAGAPLKIAVASAIGGIMGLAGGALGALTARPGAHA